ncbi:helix-turn-helix domain-containing protein [Fulvivirga ligni]|uniref:helix-turn-helix domain-containing protein n=1 Tax=Fulvivirga ligni TaxID=2904246 RepID=UPI001F43372B|nr:helix-turn-helix domain-containing protein [Fulvivirga ligni]UII22295.1 helix-turn-helix domain-containing protein [Fulvivirga ligni]
MSILFLIASLGVINGFIVSIFLLVNKRKSVADVYFAGVLFTLSLRIGKSIYFYFNEEVNLTILQIGLSACAFIGPFFFLYMKALYNPQTVFRKIDIFLLSIVALLVISVGLSFPYGSYPDMWNGYIIYGIYICWGLFAGLGLIYVIKFLKMKADHRVTHWTGDQKYVLYISIAMLFITLTYFNALIIGHTYIWGALIFTFSFYYLAIRMLIPQKKLLPQSTSPALANGDHLFAEVEQIMREQKLYTNKKLKLDDLAEHAGLSKHILSQLLNETYPHGFSHYVKQYRVEEAKKLILTRPELSLEGVGYESGFNSKSSFFEAFKKIVQATPAEYKNSRLADLK